ncbi:hypothetical protein [Vreelandella sulfidaeris]|uniref:Uncharacterized protein n=1 Tax=Vreelandella sulfidaeris TaxID=115553 RepID=A0A455U3T8_9GAMM|nr:hypothetical protein HSBAA_19920 [Halomonas sulfidaeris]
MLLPKRPNLLITLAGLAIAALLSPFVLALNEEAQAAKDEGMRLYGIRKADLAILCLEQAAVDWYHQTAQHGDPYVMLAMPYTYKFKFVLHS